MPFPGDLSKHFSLHEFACKCNCAACKKYLKESDYIIANLKGLCNGVLEKIRSELDRPVIITSGFRCQPYNYVVGGVPNSQHLFGEAADIDVSGVTPQYVYKWVRDFRDEWGYGIMFDQLIFEGAHVHISFKTNRRHDFVKKGMSIA